MEAESWPQGPAGFRALRVSNWSESRDKETLMKRKMTLATLAGYFVSLALISFWVAYAQGPQQNDRVPVGFHEFEMFGEKSIYLSHYPMFGSIHSYQVILEVNLKSSDGSNLKELYLNHKHKNPKASYSVSPETSAGDPEYWVLPEVIKKGNSFRANIHLAGKTDPPVYLARNVTVEIRRVIHFRLFQPDDKKPEVLTYLLFGNDSESFMAHYIGKYEDFDQIVSVTTNSRDLHFNQDQPAALVTIPGRDNEKSLRLMEKDKTVVGRMNGTSDELKFGFATLIHYEADLEIQR
jgi:hypothetical protein